MVELFLKCVNILVVRRDSLSRGVNCGVFCTVSIKWTDIPPYYENNFEILKWGYNFG